MPGAVIPSMQWSWYCTFANAQRFIKVNDAAEKCVVEAFARQEQIHTGKEMVEKKGTIGKHNRIQFQITNQKNNHCSNTENVFRVRLRCVSVFVKGNINSH